MKRFINLKGLILVESFDSNSWSLVIEVTPQDIMPLFMDIQLLEFEQVDSLTISPVEVGNSVMLRLAENGDKSTIDQSNGKYQVQLTHRDIGTISSYLLKYYRDSYAPVDHLDIEISYKIKPDNDVTLMIKASNVAEPLSEEAVRRALGIQK